MNEIVAKILKENLTLHKDEAHKLIHLIAENQINDSQIIALMMCIQLRAYTLEEINGFRTALLELSIPIQLDTENAIDLCGTGGDGKNTFNISTTTAFVLASMNYNVIKHGNYGVSSSCGSSNVLENLGYIFTNNETQLQDELQKNNICFLHAPLFHPALKKVGKLRADLALKTFFNTLGPLINPVQPAHQLAGTFSLELAKMYQYILKPLRKQYKIIYGLDGYDEITLTDYTKVLGNKTEQTISAQNFDLERIEPQKLYAGNTVMESSKILVSILKGTGTEEQMQVVAVNTAVAMQCFHPEEDLKILHKEAIKHIKSGAVNRKFKF